MRSGIHPGLAGLGLVMLLAAGCGGEPRQVVARCGMCGMNTNISEGRFVLDFKDGTTMNACSAGCAAKFSGKQTSEIYRAQVYAVDEGKLIDCNQAFYVIGADRIPTGSMPPSVFALASEQKSDEFIREHGGKPIKMQELFEAVTKQ